MRISELIKNKEALKSPPAPSARPAAVPTKPAVPPARPVDSKALENEIRGHLEKEFWSRMSALESETQKLAQEKLHQQEAAFREKEKEVQSQSEILARKVEELQKVQAQMLAEAKRKEEELARRLQ